MRQNFQDKIVQGQTEEEDGRGPFRDTRSVTRSPCTSKSDVSGKRSREK